jgi:hypothetical protein
MRLARRHEVVLEADVELLGAAPEPDATGFGPFGQRHLLEAEDAAEVAARLLFEAGRRGELHVVDAGDHAADSRTEPTNAASRPCVTPGPSSSTGGS